MFVLHLALQGCLRAENVQYGVTADTGGHIRYLLDLVAASAARPEADRIVIVTRRFEGPPGPDYANAFERVSPKVEIVRLSSKTPSYLAKEALHAEIDSLADALSAYIDGLDARPDIIHAHYADAASLAARMEDRYGIPFIFTGHSLGRVKATALGQKTPAFAGAVQRIAAEELALSRAKLVIASSRDEAEVQYAGYHNYDPGRIRIIPPGSDLSRFTDSRPCARVDASIARFLNDPSKPCLLAIARPVRKKNLVSLVRAFGQSPGLRQKANLVIIAGSRAGLDDIDPECAETLRELLEEIDRHDLYGSIAYPKSHEPDDIAAFYAHARERRGVFVNPALNEPFGLTLLEAAASKLPIVATDSGGPNDIVESCGNGLLVDPRSPGSIADACLRIISDDALWAKFSAAGSKVAIHYDWNRHAARYHGLIGDLLTGAEPAAVTRQLLICDIDNTLVGCDECVGRFSKWRRQQPDLVFGVATGRSLHSALAILEQAGAPRPQVMITSVGSEIYRLDANGVTYSADTGWRRTIAAGWRRRALVDTLAAMTELMPQAALEHRPLKLSYFYDGAPATIEKVRARLAARGLNCSIIASHGRYLDILPVRASKGTAVDHVRRSMALERTAVFVAGDSGNDIDMLRAMPHAIIVGNFSDDLPGVPGLSHSYVAATGFAAGVIEGVDHFRVKAACKPAS